MEIGILIENNNENLELLKKNKVVYNVGVSGTSLLNDIELGLFSTKYDASSTLQVLHQDLLELAGKIAFKDKGEKDV